MENDRELWKCCFDFCLLEEMNSLTIKYDPSLNIRYNY
jgi:hypothetical protein